MRLVVTIFFVLFVSQSVFSQEIKRRKEKISIKTSAECKFCKEKIEQKLIRYKGVRKVEVDYVEHLVNVEFNSKKISAEEIREALNELGYDADDKKAKPEQTKGVRHKDN